MNVKMLKEYSYASALIQSFNDEIQETEERRTCYAGSAWSSPVMLKECDDVITRCKNRITELKEEQRHVLTWLNSIKDKQMRTAIQLKYIDGYSWKDVNDRVTHGSIPTRAFSDMVNKYIHGQRRETVIERSQRGSVNG